jgi:ATP sulfurylase
MFRLSEPHGGALVNRFVAEDEAPEVEQRAARLPQITLDERELSDLELIATGAASPLTGFLGVRDYQSVLCRLRLANGTPWPVPFTLAVTLPQLASALRAGAAALRDGRGRLRGTIAVTDAFVRSAPEEAAAMYGTDDPAHPGVRYLLSRPTGLIGGSVTVLPVWETDDRAASSRDPRERASAEVDGAHRPRDRGGPGLHRGHR